MKRSPIMKEKGKYFLEKKAGISLGMVAAVAIAALVVFATFPRPELKVDDEGEWQVLWEINSASAAEANPGAGVSGWLATFCLDYAETPGTCLMSNGTAGDYDNWGNVSGYQNADDAAAMDLASEDPFYFVVRCRFNESVCGDAGTLMSNRCKVALTVSGDETISAVEIIGNDDNIAGGGGAFVSYNGSAWLYINFCWDDGVDGYQITDDGTLTWSITISAKY